MSDPLHVAYLFSRYPVVSQTFCDSEMLALEARGVKVTVGSLNPPPDSFRHERLARLRAEILYPAPPEVMAAPDADRPPFWKEMEALAAEHERRFGADTKPLTRAQNACYFAALFRRRGVQHVHVHFANRATHTALFLKAAGFRYSFTAHAQDFMVDLANDALLRELARGAEFVIAVSDYSRGLLEQACPDAGGKIHRLYNGIALDDFVRQQPRTPEPCANPRPLRLVSIGRLIEFKGFHVLIDAVARLRAEGIAVTLKIVGDGPWRDRLQAQIDSLDLAGEVILCGIQSQQQVRGLLADADAFALACLVAENGASDVLPTVIAEAMAAGLPVVSTTVAGVPEMVSHGETGLLAEPSSAGAMADALRQLIEGGEAWRGKLGVEGRARARKQFDQDASAEQLEKRFQAAAQPASPATQAGILVVMSGFPEDPAARAEMEVYASSTGIDILTARLGSPDAAGMRRACAGEIAFFPDGVVLESIWRSRAEWRRQVDAMRRELGTAVDGEEFYVQARRAVWLADQLARRPVAQLHAFRSDCVLCVWLAARLAPAPPRLSAVIEARPVLRRSALKQLLAGFPMVSVADGRLAEELGAADEIALGTVTGIPHRRFGPLKLRQPVPMQAFREAVRNWVSHLADQP